MQDEECKAPYLALFNQITDICALLEDTRDACIAMEMVPEYDPAEQLEDTGAKGEKQK